MDLTAIRQAVQNCEVFSGYDEGPLNFLINNGQAKDYPEGHTLYRKGDTAEGTFCLIVSGNVNIISEREEMLETIGPGNILGEIGTISPQDKRTITVKASEPVEVVEWDLEAVQKEVHGLFEKLRDLARERTLNWHY